MPFEERPYGYTIFCDDIRTEIDSKLTLVGVYAESVLYVHGQFPAVLARLGFVITLMEPRKMALMRDFNIPLDIYLPGEDENKRGSMVGELIIDRESLIAAIQAPPPPDLQGEPYVRMSVPLMQTNVLITQPGGLRIRAQYGSDRVGCGTLQIRQGALPPASTAQDRA